MPTPESPQPHNPDQDTEELAVDALASQVSGGEAPDTHDPQEYRHAHFMDVTNEVYERVMREKAAGEPGKAPVEPRKHSWSLAEESAAYENENPDAQERAERDRQAFREEYGYDSEPPTTVQGEADAPTE